MSREDDSYVKRTTVETAQAYQTLRRERPWRYRGSLLTHHRVLPFATYAPWNDDGVFLRLFHEVEANTLVDLYRCWELWKLAHQVEKVEGSAIEVGVWRGGTAAILASAFQKSSKNFYLADTFDGVPKAGVLDTRYKGGEHSDTSIEIVTALFERLNLDNVTYLSGIFPEDTGHMINEKIAFLHCDVDVHDSCRDIVKWVKPRLSPGVIMVFDDFGFYGCEGVTLFLEELSEDPDFIFIHNLNGHAIFVRR